MAVVQGFPRTSSERQGGVHPCDRAHTFPLPFCRCRNRGPRRWVPGKKLEIQALLTLAQPPLLCLLVLSSPPMAPPGPLTFQTSSCLEKKPTHVAFHPVHHHAPTTDSALASHPRPGPKLAQRRQRGLAGGPAPSWWSGKVSWRRDRARRSQ